jgi:4a-hydroxytetrahydrobiopterin dehydratase
MPRALAIEFVTRSASRTDSSKTKKSPSIYPEKEGKTMATVAQEKCEACDRNAPRLTDQQLAELKPQIPDWQVVERDDIPRLERSFKLKDFAAALELTNRVGALAEEAGHHPAIVTEWGRVTVTWWTHKIRGLHRNDVIMAARTDEAAASSEQ